MRYKARSAPYILIGALFVLLGLPNILAIQISSLRWVPISAQEAVPANAIPVVEESNKPIYICRGAYSAGTHPGRIVNNQCSISYGGKEVLLDNYEVLVGTGGSWGKPQTHLAGAFIAGQEGRLPLQLCRTSYQGNIFPGKVVRNLCHFSYQGLEIFLPQFEVFYLSLSPKVSKLKHK